MTTLGVGSRFTANSYGRKFYLISNHFVAIMYCLFEVADYRGTELR